MNKRQKKKFLNRKSHRHYRDYKLWQRVSQLAEAKYGKPAVAEWITKNQDGLGSNLIKVTTTRKGWPIDVDLYSHVYPVAMRPGIPEKYQWKEPIMCPMTPLKSKCANPEEYEKVLKEYREHIKPCEAIGIDKENPGSDVLTITEGSTSGQQRPKGDLDKLLKYHGRVDHEWANPSE